MAQQYHMILAPIHTHAELIQVVDLIDLLVSPCHSRSKLDESSAEHEKKHTKHNSTTAYSIANETRLTGESEEGVVGLSFPPLSDSYGFLYQIASNYSIDIN